MNTSPLRLWQPPAETIETIAGVLRAHWLAAKLQRERLFWPEAHGWLGRDIAADPKTSVVSAFTSARWVAGS